MASNWIGKVTRNKIYQRDHMTCCYCGKVCKSYDGKMDLDTVTLDHVVSQKELLEASINDADFSKKRKDAKNIVVACNGCNASEKHHSLYAWCVLTGKNYGAILVEIGTRIQKGI
jgi:5-methylcytosine-specific restriction endonuclease McrA